MGIEVHDLGRGAPASLGAMAASRCGAEACALFGRRWRRVRDEAGGEDELDRVRAAAAATAQALVPFDEGLDAEWRRFGRDAGLEPWQLALTAQPEALRAAADLDESGCSLVYVRPADGPILAQTLDLPPEVQPFLRVLRLEPAGAPAACLFTLTGSLGVAGMNALGVGLVSAALAADDARPGVPLGAVIRRALAQPTAVAALRVLHEADIGGGRAFLVADCHHAFHLEVAGQENRLTHDDPRVAYGHANHYLHPDLRPRQRPLPLTSTSHTRQHLLGRWLARPPLDPGAVWTGLARLDPHVVGAAVSAPGASRTVGAIMFDLAGRQIYAHAGPVAGSEPTLLDMRP